MTDLTFTDSAAGSVKADVLVLASRRGKDGVELAEGQPLSRAAQKHLSSTLPEVGAEGGADEIVRLTGVPGVAAPLVLVVGTGRQAPPADPRAAAGTPDPRERLRRAAG
ncbi:M17 family peptidase N-terminal domain-containing protein, partial [Ornithinicoccus halotolerans]|uniref:M17 family peptidase N-terminal domain-containing protein n=1 Tax=Ornithinicoccus halotolerans TaxID=1748220 RepID=UPI002B1EC980